MDAAPRPLGIDHLWVVRHARAGSKRIWKAPDDQRPLDSTGQRDARTLVSLFPEPPTELIASPTRRCIQTLEPLAARHALEITPDPRLAASAASEETLELLRTAGRGAVVCTHGEVLERLVVVLRSVPIHIEGPTAQMLAKGVAWEMSAHRRGISLTIHPPRSSPPAGRRHPDTLHGDCPTLDPSDIAVLQCLPTGWSFEDIGLATGLGHSKVKERAAHIYRGLGVTTRARAIERAAAHGLLTDPRV